MDNIGYDKFIKDTRNSKMPYLQPNKIPDPIDTSNIKDDEPYRLNMVGCIMTSNGKKIETCRGRKMVKKMDDN